MISDASTPAALSSSRGLTAFLFRSDREIRSFEIAWPGQFSARSNSLRMEIFYPGSE
jgi:hypothetical protein